MYQQETFGNEAQRPPFLGLGLPVSGEAHGGGLLGNKAVQSATNPSSDYNVLTHRGSQPSVPRVGSNLLALKTERFPVKGRAERVARSLAALAESDEVVIRLTPEEWNWIAEDPDLEDDV